MASLSLTDNFNQYFEVRVADSDDLKRASYRIRHKVYSEELGWEPVNQDKLETDECDGYAFSLLLVHKRTDTYAGTVRLVIPPPSQPQEKLPFELHLAETLDTSIIDPTELTRGEFGEISRLSVPAEFRRRSNEKDQPFVISEDAKPTIFSEDERRNFPNIAIGLYLSVIAMVDMLNHSHIFVVVEPRLQKRLSRLGLNFNQCGSPVDYHGLRALFYLERSGFYADLNAELMELYNLLKQQLQQQLLLYPYQ